MAPVLTYVWPSVTLPAARAPRIRSSPDQRSDPLSPVIESCSWLTEPGSCLAQQGRSVLLEQPATRRYLQQPSDVTRSIRDGDAPAVVLRREPPRSPRVGTAVGEPARRLRPPRGECVHERERHLGIRADVADLHRLRAGGDPPARVRGVEAEPDRGDVRWATSAPAPRSGANRVLIEHRRPSGADIA